MFKGTVIAAVMALTGAAVAGAQPAQAKKEGGTKGVTYDITATADTVYTGTVELTIDRGKVTGDMLITVPTEITGKVAGTSKDGVLLLDFPYYMKENQCEGNVKMKITMPAKPGPAKGTMEAVGCGQDPNQPLGGTVELKPAAAKPAAK